MNYGKRIALITLPSKCKPDPGVSSTASKTDAKNMNTDSESMVSFDEFEDGVKDNVKRKTRNLSEKKRRDQFNMLVNELFSMVSVNNKKMDKSTVLKSTIAFLKNHQEIAVQSQIHEIKEDWKPSFLSNDEFSQLMLEALDSFLLVFTIKGKILYVSESVTSLLGHLPNDLISKPLYNFLHESDREKVANYLQDFRTTAKLSEEFSKEENQLSFKCHIKCGSVTSQEPQMYEAVEFTGTCRPLDCLDEAADGQVDSDSYLYMRSPSTDSMCLCCTVRLQTTKIIREMPIQNDFASEFTSRHSLGWKFLFLDHRAPPVIGYLPFELLGTSGYDYYHPDDLEKISKCHEQLMQTGEGTSCHYRFLTKGQQWIWLKTRYYITYHQWNSKPEFIVCTNTVISFSDVRSSVRKEMGIPEEDTEITSMDEMEMERGEQSPPCSVTSGPSSHLLSSSLAQSETPDVLSGLGETGDSNQMPHSTQLEIPTTSKSVTSQLQTFIQQQPQPQPQPSPKPAQEMTSSSSPSTSMVATPSVVPHGMVPVKIMNFPAGILTVQQNQLNRLQQQPQIFMTPAQRLLHDQLLHKSEQLQDAIRHQQEELRQITEQLTQAQQLSTPLVQGVPETSSPMMIQPMMQPMTVSTATPHQVMMISPMNTMSVVKQAQQQQAQPPQQQIALNQQVQVQQQIQLQQVLQQPQLQPCLPFQIVPEAEDMNFSTSKLQDS